MMYPPLAAYCTAARVCVQNTSQRPGARRGSTHQGQTGSAHGMIAAPGSMHAKNIAKARQRPSGVQ